MGYSGIRRQRTFSKRLKGRDNPIGWFTAEVLDRFTSKSLWLNQQAIKHIKDKSNVILYLVNASEPPESLPYVQAEMQILNWISKPVIVLLNQIGEIKPQDEEQKEVQVWKDFLSSHSLIKAVLPLDAFARCWVQEYELWNQIKNSLTDKERPTFESLQQTWIRGRQAIYASSVDARPVISQSWAEIKKFWNPKALLKDSNLLAALWVLLKMIFMVQWKMPRLLYPPEPQTNFSV